MRSIPLLLAALLCACNSSPPAKPAAKPAQQLAKPEMLTASLAALTPPTDGIAFAAAGDTLVITQYWTPSKGSGTTMISQGGQNGTGGKTGKSDTTAYAAGLSHVRIAGARPAPGDSTSLWFCKQAWAGALSGGSVCGSKWYKQPAVVVPPSTPPNDSTTVAITSRPLRVTIVALSSACAGLAASNAQWTNWASAKLDPRCMGLYQGKATAQLVRFCPYARQTDGSLALIAGYDDAYCLAQFDTLSKRSSYRTPIVLSQRWRSILKPFTLAAR